jgi:hypothetical protein
MCVNAALAAAAAQCRRTGRPLEKEAKSREGDMGLSFGL